MYVMLCYIKYTEYVQTRLIKSFLERFRESDKAPPQKKKLQGYRGQGGGGGSTRRQGRGAGQGAWHERQDRLKRCRYYILLLEQTTTTRYDDDDDDGSTDRSISRCRHEKWSKQTSSVV